jgi:hypothetical protein
MSIGNALRHPSGRRRPVPSMAPIKMNIRISLWGSIAPYLSPADIVLIIAWNSQADKPREQATLGDLPRTAEWLIFVFAQG